jgi:hypothetical protein
MEDYSSMY